jgi:hypothetical protein
VEFLWDRTVRGLGMVSDNTGSGDPFWGECDNRERCGLGWGAGSWMEWSGLSFLLKEAPPYFQPAVPAAVHINKIPVVVKKKSPSEKKIDKLRIVFF